MPSPVSHARRSSAAESDVIGRASIHSTTYVTHAECQPLLTGAPSPQVFAHPVQCASITSRLLLQWVTPSITLANQSLSQNSPPDPTSLYYTQFQPPRQESGQGYAKRGLKQADVWELPPRFRTEPDAKTLQRAWIISGSLLHALFRAHGLQFILLGLLYTLAQLCDLVGPYVLCLGIQLLQEEGLKHFENDATRQSFYFWLAALFVSRLVRSLLLAFVRTELQTLTLRLTAALQSLVFQKALRLANVIAEHIDTISEADVTQLLHGAACIHEAWVSLIVLASAFSMMTTFLGIQACGAAFGAMIVVRVGSETLNKLQARSVDQLRRSRENRERSTNEMVQAITAVKLHAWESAARARINTMRGRELADLWRFHLRGATLIAIRFVTPGLVAAAALIVAHYTSAHPLTPSLALGTLALVHLIQTPLRALSHAVLGARPAWRSLHNLSCFMDQEELNFDAVAGRNSLNLAAKYDAKDTVIAVEDATLGWATDGPMIFHHLDVTVAAGELVVVHGRPGSGKSSFLLALLGEMQAHDGNDGGNCRLYVGGSIAYCPQQPWLQKSLSVRDNIIFGLPFDRRKYQHVLDACGLVSPIALLSAGDRTLVKDWRASPGEQALVNLARACYSDADVYLLDEPLAQVLPRSVAQEIFSRCVLRILRNKTRIIVTTSVEFINSNFVNDAIRFEDGGRLVHTRDVYSVTGGNEQQNDERSDERKVQAGVATSLYLVNTYEPLYVPVEVQKSAEHLCMENILNTSRSSLCDLPLREYVSFEVTAAAELSDREWPLKSIRAYAHLIGGLRGVSMIFVMLFLWQALQVMSDLWVVCLVHSSNPPNFMNGQLIYCSMVLAAGLLALGFTVSIAVAAIQGARCAFLKLTSAILNSPLFFFDANGAGSGRARSKRLTLSRRRELERVITDKHLTVLDTRLPLAVGAVLALGASTLSAILTVAVVTRYYAAFLLPVIYMYVQAARLYLQPARDIIRLETIARQSARMHAAETLAGARVVRTFGLAHVHRVMGHHFWLSDVAARNAHLGLHIDQWLALRIQFYGAVIVEFVATLSFLILRHSLGAGLLALALYEVLLIDNGVLESLVRMCAWLSPVLHTATQTLEAARGAEVFTEGASYLIATSRPAENPTTPNEVKPSLSWPTTGDLRFDAVSFRDPAAVLVDEMAAMFDIGDGGAPPLALKSLSFRLQAGEKVAILESPSASKVSFVGRALLRLHELTAGRIIVDGIDIATLGLRTLRSRIACVSAATPNAALYNGSVRMQLNPCGAAIEDEQLWAALRAVRLADNLSSLNDHCQGLLDLEHDLSLRFLLSLARALLGEPSVVILAIAPVLDTPNDDMAAQMQPNVKFALDDAVLKILQRVMHEELRDATILLLLPSATLSPYYDQIQRAMLLNSVDRVLVVSDGEMAALPDSTATVPDQGRLKTLSEVPSRLRLSDLESSSKDMSAIMLHQKHQQSIGEDDIMNGGKFDIDTSDNEGVK